ncbi:MAG: ATP phosphoribosyltransferase [Coriobacteriia bacterium]|nr:ATP phosphoribosyltransferase [Coriobacteriia bacterium]
MVEAAGSGSIRIALPKGRFHGPTADMLDAHGFGMDEYTARSRQYRVGSARFPGVTAKILQERDISVHVSVGNYDLGICGADWVRELKARYPAAGLVELSALDYHEGAVFLASSVHGDLVSLGAVTGSSRAIRIASEYPSLATRLAAQLRLRRFQVFPVWGAAEAYPPESADLVVIWAKNERDLTSQGLVPLMKLFDVDAMLVANGESLSRKDMSDVLSPLEANFRQNVALPAAVLEEAHSEPPDQLLETWQSRLIRLALPDGHQKTPAVELLERAGISVPGYSGRTAERRLLAHKDWLSVKVIRPQDMPLQVASGHFDIAVTGQDWLTEHRVSFPGSPVTELVDLGFGKVRVVAALSESIPVDSTEELRHYLAQSGGRSLRVASEYTNIADRYLRENHIGWYKVMPTWGASEAFLPDDADLLVDNTQTGKTLVDNGLKIIEVILRSSACLIANVESLDDPAKRERIDGLATRLAGAVQ